jgi:hypothetical protein
MTTYLMLDDVNLTILGEYAKTAHALAGYVDGSTQSDVTWPTLLKDYGNGDWFLLSIDVQNDPSAHAQCLDIETGDASPADAPSWWRATREAGIKARDLRWYPKLYASRDTMPGVLKAMDAQKIDRAHYRVWSAHYTDKEHICAPDTCGAAFYADATQWTDQYQGVSLDASSCYGRFFDGPPSNTVVGPARHVADGTVSLDTKAGTLHSNVKDVLKQSSLSCDDGDVRALLRYVANGVSFPMPKGLIFYTPPK